ncbi:hypothetical protein BBAD15_g7239 [Beauveria bassiana D1-5]|uniref:Uncharacterized protein n=1 Tax=Beauveria bassiana D1-5 TaxID=1245745 RepID=A0A0A2W3B1_BEABA|nr:hypothetical protein BBAD15_g7239 [Beauveria bassiana D1-5]
MNLSDSRQANSKRSIARPDKNFILNQFIRRHDNPHGSFSFLKKNTRLLDKGTIERLECKACERLRQTDSLCELEAQNIIAAAALLEICARKSPVELKEKLLCFAVHCMKTKREHSEHALEMCDRIERKFNHDNVAVALDKMSLKADEAALVQTIQV